MTRKLATGAGVAARIGTVPVAAYQRSPGGNPADDAVGHFAGVLTGLARVLARPLYVPLFSTDETLRAAIAAVIPLVARFQPVAGVVFVLDGVLIGTGDARYLAAAGVGTMLAFLPAAAAVLHWDLGLPGPWWAIGVFMLARPAFLAIRARGGR